MSERPREGPADEDAAWAEILAAWDAPAATRDTTPPPGSPPPPPTQPAQPAQPASPAPQPAAQDSRTTAEEGPTRAPAAPGADAEEHFVPPPPPPLPTADAFTWLAWAGALGGPAYLLLATLLGWHAAGWEVAAAVGGFVGGFLTLVARMRDRDPYDHDDGAVV